MTSTNLNLYRYFYEVAKSKSYTDASNKMYISKTAISKNIKELETQLGTQLFYRENNGVRLTIDGEKLFQTIDKSLTEIDATEKLLLMKNNLETGEIVIGSLSHIASFYLMPYIEKVKKDYKDLKVKLITAANGKELVKLLEEHKIDFAIDTTVLDNQNTQIVKEKLKELENVFISKEDIKIKQLKDLEKYNFIVGLGYTSTSKRLLKKLKEYNVDIKSTLEIDITELKVNAVKRNLGISYVLKDSVKEELANREIFEIKVPIELPKSDLNLVYLKGQLTKADNEFIKKYLKNGKN